MRKTDIGMMKSDKVYKNGNSDWAINKRYFTGISKRKADAGKDRIEQDKGWINSSNLGIEQQGENGADMIKDRDDMSRKGVWNLLYRARKGEMGGLG